MNEAWQGALGSYRSFNPAGWVAAYKLFPIWGGLLLIVVGVLFMIFGGGRLFRLVAGPIGALIGYLWTPMIAGRFGFALHDEALSLAGAAFLGVMGFIFPPGVVFFAVGIPAGLIGGSLMGNDWWMGFLPACFFGGIFAAIGHRVISSIVSSLVGAWLLVIGMLSALNEFGTVVHMVTQQPWGVVIAAALFAMAGSVYQLAVRPSPEEAADLAAEKAFAKKKAEERKANEKTYRKYTHGED